MWILSSNHLNKIKRTQPKNMLLYSTIHIIVKIFIILYHLMA